MKFIKPNFYDRFRCTASACSDTCCAGWEIDIDPDTKAYYEELEGDFGERLREQIEELPDGAACFRLTDDERCPFLTDDNLCEVIHVLGDDGLCEICREHPRFYEQLGDRMEMGVGLCCEEACRLLFEQREPITFITTTVGEMPDAAAVPDSGMQIFRLRDEAFRLVQDRSLPLRVRMHRLIDFGARVHRELLRKPAASDAAPSDDADTREALLQVMEALEPYDEVRLREPARLLFVPPLRPRHAGGKPLGARQILCRKRLVHLPDEHEMPARYRRVYPVGPHHLHEGLFEAGRVQRGKHGRYAARPAQGPRIFGGKPQAAFRIK